MFTFVKTPPYTGMASDRSTILLYPENIILIEQHSHTHHMAYVSGSLHYS